MKKKNAQNVGFMKLYYKNMEKKKGYGARSHTLDW